MFDNYLRMKAKDGRKKSTEDLKKLLEERAQELRDFRFGMSGSARKNVRKARTLRADIARIKTILNEHN